MNVAPGTRIGRWLVVAPLGRGGMGVVYRARDDQGREGALKLVLLDAALDADTLARFEREVRAARAIDHANVIGVLDAGQHGGRPFLVTELAAGGSLHDRLARGVLPWREAVRFGLGIARGLVAIHAQGLVHRDLKPANVLLDEAGTPKVADLGLVRSTEGAVSRDLTKTGDVVGTPAFAAPEQLDASKSVDARADLYALGATLHALLAGQPPFAGAGYALVKQVLMARPPALRSLVPGVPERLEHLVLSLLAKDPADRRPATAREVAEELERLASARESRRGAYALATAVVLAALVAGGVAWRSHSIARAAEEAARRAQDDERRANEEHEKLVREAEQHLARRSWRDAIETATRGLERGPDARLLEVRGLARLAHEARRERALEDLVAAMRLAPGSARARAGAARCELRLRHRDRALALAREGVALDQSCALAHVALAEALSGDPSTLDAAIAEASRAIALAPDLAAAYTARAQVKRSRSEHAEALEDLERALARDPDDATALEARSLARRALRDLSGSRADAERVVVLAPHAARSWAARAGARLEQGELDGAIEDATRAIELDENEGFGWLQRALARKAAGDFSGSADDALRAADLLGVRDIRALRLEMLCRAARLDEALRECDEAIARDATFAEAWYLRGTARATINRLDEAEGDIEQALRLAPGAAFVPEAQAVLERVRQKRR